MSKTYIALILASFKVFEREQKGPNEKIQLKADNLVIYLFKDKLQIILEDTKQFEPELYKIVISCFNLYNEDTKLLFFN